MIERRRTKVAALGDDDDDFTPADFMSIGVYLVGVSRLN